MNVPTWLALWQPVCTASDMAEKPETTLPCTPAQGIRFTARPAALHRDPESPICDSCLRHSPATLSTGRRTIRTSHSLPYQGIGMNAQYPTIP